MVLDVYFDFSGLLSTASFDWIESRYPIRECISPVLQILGVLDDHRAVQQLRPEDLRRIHHCLWGHANLQMQRGMRPFFLSNMTEETHKRYESLLSTNETPDARPTKAYVEKDEFEEMEWKEASTSHYGRALFA